MKVIKSELYNNLNVLGTLKIPILSSIEDIRDNYGRQGDILITQNTGDFCYHDGTTWRLLNGDSNISMNLRNIGDGVRIYQDTKTSTHNIRTLQGGTFIKIKENVDTIDFELNLNAENLDVGGQLAEIYVNNSLENTHTLQFYKLQSKDGTILIENIDDTVNFRVDFESNITGNNLGNVSYPSLYIDNTSPNFNFRRLRPLNDSITILENGDYLDIELQIQNSDVSNGYKVYENTNGTPYTFKQFLPGTYVTLDDTTIPGAIIINSTNIANTFTNIGDYNRSGRFDVYNNSNEFRRLFGSTNASIPTNPLYPTPSIVQTEDTRINDYHYNPNPSLNGNKVGVPIEHTLTIYVNNDTTIGKDFYNGLSAIPGTGDNGPVNTLERAFEILRFRSYVTNATIKLINGSVNGNHLITPGRNNFNIGTRGREKKNVMIEGDMLKSLFTSTIDALLTHDGDGLIQLQIPTNQFTEHMYGKICRHTDISNNIREFMIIGREDADPLTATNIITIAYTDSSFFNPGDTIEILERTTNLVITENTSFETDNYYLHFKDITFVLDTYTFSSVRFDNMNMIWTNIGFQHSSTSLYDSLITVTNSTIITNRIGFSDDDQNYTGVFIHNNCLNQQSIQMKWTILKSTMSLYNSGFKGTNNNSIMIDSYDSYIDLYSSALYKNYNTNSFLSSNGITNITNFRIKGCYSFTELKNYAELRYVHINNIDFEPTISDKALSFLHCNAILHNVYINGSGSTLMYGIYSEFSHIQATSLRITKLYATTNSIGIYGNHSNMTIDTVDIEDCGSNAILSTCSNISLINLTLQNNQLYSTNKYITPDIYIENSNFNLSNSHILTDKSCIRSIHSHVYLTSNSINVDVSDSISNPFNLIEQTEGTLYIKNDHYTLQNQSTNVSNIADTHLIHILSTRLYAESLTCETNNNTPIHGCGLYAHGSTIVINSIQSKLFYVGMYLNGCVLTTSDTNTNVSTIDNNEFGIDMNNSTLNITQPIHGNNNKYAIRAHKNVYVSGLTDSFSGNIASYNIPNTNISHSSSGQPGLFNFTDLNVYCIDSQGVEKTEPNVILLT